MELTLWLVMVAVEYMAFSLDCFQTGSVGHDEDGITKFGCTVCTYSHVFNIVYTLYKLLNVRPNWFKPFTVCTVTSSGTFYNFPKSNQSKLPSANSF
jgi:hypothetical protein